MGYVNDLGDGRLSAPRGLIQRLEVIDIERVGKVLAAERALQWRSIVPAITSVASLSAQPSYPVVGSR